MAASKSSVQAELQEHTGLIRPSSAFDYGTLAAAVRKQVIEEAAEIRTILEKTAENIVQIGIRLNLVHDRIGRDHFQSWLAAEFQWDRSTASNYMRAAAAFCEVKCLNRFQPGALYELVRKRVPDGARAEAIDRANHGEMISKSEAETIVRKHSTSPPRKRGSIASQFCRRLARMTTEIDSLSAADAEHIHRHILKLLSVLERVRSSSPSEPATDGQAAIATKARRQPPSPARKTRKRTVPRSSRNRKKRRHGA
jgi:hypothetical protein